MDATRELLELRASRLQMAYTAAKAMAFDPVTGGPAMNALAKVVTEGGYPIEIAGVERMTAQAFAFVTRIERDLAQANRDLANYVFATR